MLKMRNFYRPMHLQLKRNLAIVCRPSDSVCLSVCDFGG